MLFGKKKEEVVYRLEDVNCDPYTLPELKNSHEILIIDDKGFGIIGTLQSNGFRVTHWTDVEDVSTTAKYPIIACDISGIGKKLRPGSRSGGIHVLREIKKHYPDKYLIQYSTQGQDIDESLTKADKIYPKDTSVDAWQDDIENALKEFGNPKKRWLRIRRRLSDEGVDALDIYNLEQAYIKDILSSDEGELDRKAKESTLSPDVKDMVVRFATTTILMGIKELMR